MFMKPMRIVSKAHLEVSHTAILTSFNAFSHKKIQVPRQRTYYLVMQAIADWMLGLDWDQKVTRNHASSYEKSRINNPATRKS